MAALSPTPSVGRDTRGAVYVEFLIALMPMLTLFFAICQLSLLLVAEEVVQHASLRAARSAIVVLPEKSEHFDGVGRGVLSESDANDVLADGTDILLRAIALLEMRPGDVASLGGIIGPSALGSPAPQRGRRMTPIRAAAHVPLLAIAPSGLLQNDAQNLSRAVSLSGDRLSAMVYTRLATSIFLLAAPHSSELAREPIGRSANVHVRVTYLFPCKVPIVERLLCDTLEAITEGASSDLDDGARALFRTNGAALRLLTGKHTRFRVLRGETTLPNQGAAYEESGG